jgi:hypothetical protein
VLILGAAAATVWFAWPARQGTVSKRALWGLGAMAVIVAFLSAAVFAALGNKREDLVFTAASQTVEPSLGPWLLLAAVATQVVGIVLVRDVIQIPPFDSDHLVEAGGRAFVRSCRRSRRR